MSQKTFSKLEQRLKCWSIIKTFKHNRGSSVERIPIESLPDQNHLNQIVETMPTPTSTMTMTTKTNERTTFTSHLTSKGTIFKRISNIWQSFWGALSLVAVEHWNPGIPLDPFFWGGGRFFSASFILKLMKIFSSIFLVLLFFRLRNFFTGNSKRGDRRV